MASPVSSVNVVSQDRLEGVVHFRILTSFLLTSNEGVTQGARKSKGCSQKTSGRSYSLKHPVARHFVCSIESNSLAIRNCLKRRHHRVRLVVGIALIAESFTSPGPRKNRAM